MIRVVVAVILLIMTLGTSAQEQQLVQMMEDQATSDEEREQEEDLQQLHQFSKRQLNVNKADRDLLSLIPFLSAHQIEQFLLYRKMLGPLADVLELQAIPGWDIETVRRILPYVTVDAQETLADQFRSGWKKARQQLILRTTAGNSPSLLLRYGVQLPAFRFGFTLDKDRGEKLFQGKKGVAFLSAHASFRGKELVKQLIIGDHLVNFGQGLLMWQGRGFRKNGATVMVKRQLPAFQEYRSADENRFMRGVALSLARKRISADIFVSRNLQDANIVMDSAGGREVSSFLFSGIHRTESELEDKNSLALLQAGFSLHYSLRQWKISYQELFHHFSVPVNKGDDPYERLSFRGSMLRGRSISYHHTWRNIHWFGEFASGGSGTAFLNGLMVAADKKLDLALVGRRINKHYHAFGANAFTEFSGVNNEEGVYLGMTWRLLPSLAVDVYADHFRSSWLRYRVNAPGFGYDHHVQLTWRPSRHSTLFIRWKRDGKIQNMATEDALRPVGLLERETLRVHLERRISEAVEWRSRLEWVWIQPEMGLKERGYYFYSDLFFKWRRLPFSGNLRLMIHETSGYASRVYAYENDVMYYSLIPSYYGSGVIAYLNIRAQLTDALGLFIKWHLSSRDGVNRSQIRAQIVFSW